MCDEYTDVSNKQQLSMCVRWIDDSLNPHEDFLGFYELPNIASDTIVYAMLVGAVKENFEIDNDDVWNKTILWENFAPDAGQLE